MAGGWKLVVEVCLPVPFVLLVLLSLPAPRSFLLPPFEPPKLPEDLQRSRSFNRGVLTVVDKTLGLTFVGALSLLHIMLIVTGTCFLASIKTTSDVLASKPFDADASPNVIAGHLGKRWRAERNFWISFICFFLWCLLARFFQIMKVKARTEDELRLLKSGGSAASIPASRPDVAEPKKAK